MAYDVQHAAAPPPPVSLPNTLTDDERWQAWVAKGAADDRVVRQRWTVLLPALGVAGLFAAYLLLGF